VQGAGDPFKNTLFVIDDAVGEGGTGPADAEWVGGEEAPRAQQRDQGGGGGEEEGRAEEAGAEGVACGEADFARLLHEDTPITSSCLTRAVQTTVSRVCSANLAWLLLC
jgi:hypothetical protein